MTNARDLQNHMVGDPVDNRVEFGTDYKGDMTYADQKVWLYQGELFTDQDKQDYLKQGLKYDGVPEQIMGAIVGEFGARQAVEWLLTDDAVDIEEVLKLIGATVANEGDAA